MRHQKKGFKLGRTQSHRKATLASMAHALIAHKRITTTRAKARALRMFIEPLITRAKQDSTHNRREVFRLLQNKQAVKELFDEIGGQVGDRPGGYTRIVKLGQRAGDSAEMAIIELVDYNDEKPEGASSDSGKRRTRRSGGRKRRSSKAEPKAEKTEAKAEKAEAKAEKAEAKAEEKPVDEPVVEEQAADETAPEAADETPAEDGDDKK